MLYAPTGIPDKPTVLIVDDTPENLLIITDILKDSYHVKVSANGNRALAIAQSTTPPDLILLDVMMPEIDGYEVCRRLKDSPATSAIPIIFLTARVDDTDETFGLSLGAVDYIHKPVNPDILSARVATQLQVKAAADFLRDQNAFLEREVEKRTTEITAVQKVTILALASLAETRDIDTGGHLWRTQRYIQLLARHLQQHPRFRATLTNRFIEALFESAPLHDIGKVGIPDQILQKPGRLSAAEFEVIKTHPLIGYTTIVQAEKAVGRETSFLKIAREIILSHHEKWDGTGYPEGLSGEDIPLAARLMALVDVYDSLISSRVYRAAMPHEVVARIILEGRGTHFDPDIVDAFISLQEEFRQIAGDYEAQREAGNYPRKNA